MTDDKKHDDKDRKKHSDEEMEDVAGGEGTSFTGVLYAPKAEKKGGRSSTSSRSGSENHSIRDPGKA